MTIYERSLVWFRRDLRTADHSALSAALAQSKLVYCVFVFDRDILDRLDRRDRRVEFIHAALLEVDQDLRRMGGALLVRHEHARTAIPQMCEELRIDAVFANRDYEPQAIARDQAVAASLRSSNRDFLDFKDQVILEAHELVSAANKPYSVFTPYKRAWLKQIMPAFPQGPELALCATRAVDAGTARLAKPDAAHPGGVPSLRDIGFGPTDLARLGVPTGMAGAAKLLEEFVARIGRYQIDRNLPAVRGSSFLSAHLRFGTISIRALVRRALEAMYAGDSGDGAATWLSELIWREFFSMILQTRPEVTQRAFKPEFNAIAWETGAAADHAFDAWRSGRTGYPLIDAAMTQLEQTGYLHNRLRMVTASFLTKDLGIDWRRGEAHFAEKLLDYELASNNGGWQWAASTGCDAQPWFRIFNPVLQSRRFDPNGAFIRGFLPLLAKLDASQLHAPWKVDAASLAKAEIELGGNYPAPIVDHAEARRRTLARYAAAARPTRLG
jgi:deoxyribodipyrimidine photo-lyase